MTEAATLNDMALPSDEAPVSALAEPRREAYQLALCRVTEIAGALHMAVSMVPDDDALIRDLADRFCAAALISMSALEDFKTARDCAGSA